MKIYTMVCNRSDGHEAGIQKSRGLYNSIIPINYYNTLRGQELRSALSRFDIRSMSSHSKYLTTHITQVYILV